MLSGEAVTVYGRCAPNTRLLCRKSFNGHGCGYDVLARSYLEYKSHGELHGVLCGQAYLITHVVFTLNNWGELALEPELLPHEHLFIRENLGVAVRGSVRRSTSE